MMIPTMPRTAKILAGIITALLLLGGLTVAYLKQEAALEMARTQRDQAGAELRPYRRRSRGRAELMGELSWTRPQHLSVLDATTPSCSARRSIARSQQTLERDAPGAPIPAHDLELQKLCVDIPAVCSSTPGEATLQPEGRRSCGSGGSSI
jgi:hypothetical protein